MKSELKSCAQLVKYNILLVGFFSLFLFSATVSFSQNITINGSITSTDPSYNNSSNYPINICSYAQSIVTIVSCPTNAANVVITQTLPGNSSINISPITNSCNAGITQVIGSSSTTVTYTIPSLTANVPCTVEVAFYLPCDIQPNYNSVDFRVNYSINNPYTLTLIPDPFTFQINRPVMIFNRWTDHLGFPIPPNTPQYMLVSDQHFRQFDMEVTYGLVESLTLVYNHEPEIVPTLLEFTGWDDPITIHSGTTTILRPSPTSNQPINSADINTLFPGNPISGKMGIHQIIRVKEHFIVIDCSSAATITTDVTNYALNLECPATPSTPICTTRTATQNIEVLKTPGGMSASLHGIYQPNTNTTMSLDICGVPDNSPSDIVIRFQNATTGPSPLLVGSAMKTLHQVTFPINLGLFPVSGGVFLEYGNTSVDVSTIGGGNFYSYTAERCTLDFDALALNEIPLGTSGPLLDRFYQDSYYREITDGGYFDLRFKGMEFDCHANGNNIFYPQPQNNFPFGYGLADCTKPSIGALFFAKGNQSLDGANFYYDDMCNVVSNYTTNTASTLAANPTVPNSQSGMYYANNFPVTGFAETDRTDVYSSDPCATIDYYYQYTGGAVNPNPFAFGGPYFNCSPGVVYQATISIPAVIYNSPPVVTYYPDPNNTSITSPVTVGPPVLVGNNNTYLISGAGITYKGKFSVAVCFNGNCTGGGLDDFSIVVQAACGGCSTCAYTLVCFGTQLFHHCPGPCCTAPACPAQGTNGPFVFDRSSLGWIDETDYINNPNGSPTIAGQPGLKHNRVYPCDDIHATCSGSISDPSGYSYVVNSLTFEITYANPSSSLLQFFEFDNGTLTYTLPNTTTGSVPVTASFPNTCTTCILDVNVPNSILPTLLSNGATISIDFNLHVRSDVPACGSGNDLFSLPQIRAQFVTNGTQPSCDPWGDNMTILSPCTGDKITIYSPGNADQSDGFPYGDGICERRFVIKTFVNGGLGSFDDFPDEFRPIVQWPIAANPLWIDQDAPNITLGWAEFTARGVAGWAPIHTVTNGNQITFDGYGAYGIGSCAPSDFSTVHNWPILDKNGGSMTMLIHGAYSNSCSPRNTQTDAFACPSCSNNTTIVDPPIPIQINFPYVNRAYADNPAVNSTPSTMNSVCKSIPRPNPINFTYPASNYDLFLQPSSAQYTVNSIHTIINHLTLDFRACQHIYAPNSINNVWIRSTLPNLTINSITVNGGPSILPDINGYFHVSHGTGCAPVDAIGQCYDYTINLDVTLNGCTPPIPFPVNIEYGFSCAGYPPANPPCFTHNLQFDILPLESAWQILVTPNNVLSGSPCNTYAYDVILTSTLLGDIEFPQMLVTPPAGMTIVGVPTFTYQSGSGNLTTYTQNGNLYTYNINADIFNSQGIPGLQTCTLHYVFQGSCINVGQQSIQFTAVGQNICGGNLAPQGALRYIDFTQYPPVPDPVLTLHIPPAINCGTSNQFTATITTNLSSSFVGTLRYTACFPTSAFCSIANSTPPYTSSLGNGCYEWIIPYTQSSSPLQISVLLNACPSVYNNNYIITSTAELTSACSNGICFGNSSIVQQSIGTQVSCCSSSNIVITPSFASNGDITAIVTGTNPPFNFLWSTGAITPTIVVTQYFQTYTVTVTDVLGCTASLVIVGTGPADCGGYCTYNMEKWGSPSNSDPIPILNSDFYNAFPTGNLLVGCAGGYSITLNSPDAVRCFLPYGGAPTPNLVPLTTNYGNPICSPPTQSYPNCSSPYNIHNTLLAETATLMCNVYFDLNVPSFSISNYHLAYLTIVNNPVIQPVFYGSTVMDVLDLANGVIGGCITAPYPPPYNGISQANMLNYLQSVIHQINVSYENCHQPLSHNHGQMYDCH